MVLGFQLADQPVPVLSISDVFGHSTLGFELANPVAGRFAFRDFSPCCFGMGSEALCFSSEARNVVFCQRLSTS